MKHGIGRPVGVIGRIILVRPCKQVIWMKTSHLIHTFKIFIFNQVFSSINQLKVTFKVLESFRQNDECSFQLRLFDECQDITLKATKAVSMSAASQTLYAIRLSVKGFRANGQKFNPITTSRIQFWV